MLRLEKSARGPENTALKGPELENLSTQQLQALKEWIPFFSTLMLTVYAFYFGSRGIEKVQKIRAAGSVDMEKVKSGTRDTGLGR